MSSKSVYEFLSYVVHKQTDRQTDKQATAGKSITFLAEVINVLTILLCDHEVYTLDSTSGMFTSCSGIDLPYSL